MSISSNHSPVANREEAVKLFISAIQAVPGSFPQGLSGEDIAKHIIKGSEKLFDYILADKSGQPPSARNAESETDKPTKRKIKGIFDV
jgi:hypothetical protein